MIKKLVTIAALAMLLGSPASYADELVASSIPGNKLFNYCEEEDGFFEGVCVGYVLGIYDSLVLAGIGDPVLRICPPIGVSNEQNRDIVRKYLRDNPEKRHKGAHYLVAVALLSAFPCSD